MRQSLMPSSENLDVVRRYLKSVENGAFSEIAALFTPAVVMEQLPNRIYPQGLRATISQMAAAFEKGRKLLSSQTYEIKNAVTKRDSVAIESSGQGHSPLASAPSLPDLTCGVIPQCSSNS